MDVEMEVVMQINDTVFRGGYISYDGGSYMRI